MLGSEGLFFCCNLGIAFVYKKKSIVIHLALSGDKILEKRRKCLIQQPSFFFF